MGGNIPACPLPDDAVSSAGTSPEAGSHRLGVGKERMRSFAWWFLAKILALE